MQKIAKDILIETKFPGVTVAAIVGDDGLVCIDTPTHPTDARLWRQQLEQATGKPIRFIVNLDHHRDRLLGNQWLEAPVIAHEATYDRVRMMPELYRNLPGEPGADAELVTDLTGLRVVAPQITFADRMTLQVGARELHLIHKPGAAPGAVWAEIPAAGVVFTGDSLTHKVPPFLQEAQFDLWLENLTELRRRRTGNRVIVPGRGSVTNKDSLKPMEDFLKLARRKLEAFLRAKKPRADLEPLAQELLGRPAGAGEIRQLYLRRLRIGLEHQFDRLSLAASKS